MTEVHSKALEKPTIISRVISKREDRKGITVVIFAGIHGNENSGIFAIQEVFKSIEDCELNGSVYGISGNLKALELNKRFIDEDLNRIWTFENLEKLIRKKELNTEENEQSEIFDLLNEIISLNPGPFYFIDLHTTSSKTLPFVTISDALINRRFSKLFPVPIVLGIEEFLNGPLLTYINQLGYVSIGFESGQHDELNSINYHASFLYLALVFSRILKKEGILDFDKHYNKIADATNNHSEIYEVVHLHRIKENDNFKMLNGFKSFQPIKKGVLLANNNDEEIRSKKKGILFMPLYQDIGEDGFFIVRKVKPIFLRLSAILRRAKADNLLVLFPGIHWENKRKHVLKVDLKVARFFAKQVFHLFGFRSKQVDETHLKLYNRARNARTDLYKKESWFNSPY
ncbi:MAG: aspartoacylase [Flavobacteriaceae bacterium]|nr:succinylglutamate desuccinylase/aspartoacylase family protein [Bacteroidia bacterium]NNL16775.1 aspartoacylase [Flavobacteriaceae bacterium]